MALQVWLPLIRDLSNQGLANVTITNNGATFNSNGKLGGCYYFTPEQWIKISVPEHMTTIKNTTVAVWVKSHSTSLAVGGISHDGNSDLAGVTLTSGGWQISGSAGAWKYVNSGTIANTQVWHHAACTIDDNEITIYLDGVKVTTSTLTAQGIVNTDITSSNFIEIGCDHPGGNEFFTGYINDFRIYDHCLSVKEVKELSKGLVLHYKLDKINGGPTNYYQSTKNVHILTNGSNLTKDTSINGFYWTSSATSTSTRIDNVITSTGYWTISGEAKVSTGTGKLNIDLNDISGTTTVDLTTDYQPINWTINNTKTVDSTYHFIDLNISNIAANTLIYIKDLKIEQGTKASSWSPNPVDTAYTHIKYDKEFDCSGYNYDGEVIGSLESFTDTPRYDASVIFANNTDTISPMACFSNNQTLTALTTSIWAKTNTMNSVAPNLISLGENSFWRFRIASATSVWYYIRVGTTQISNTLSVPSSITSTLLDNKWHLYTLVFDQGVAKFYIDGVLIGTGNHTGTATYLTCGSTAWHLAGYASNAENFIGSLSDFRIYVTALSADDILELYHTAANIDNHGNIYAGELKEV